MGKCRELAIAAPVIAQLESNGWDCYPEVMVRTGDTRADIVAVRGGVVRVVEAKTSVTLSLLTQAMNWRDSADEVMIAVPREPKGAARVLCRDYGIGYYVVTGGELVDSLRIEPKRQKPFNGERQALLNALHPDMKNYKPGGTNGDGFSTPFKRTIAAAVEFLRADFRPRTIKEIVAGIDHHYANDRSAENSLRFWLSQNGDVGVIKGLDRKVRYRAKFVKQRRST